MRLIDADALRDKLQNEIDKATPPYDDVIGSMRCGVRLARNIVEDEPTVDAVPVIRCKDCKHLTHTPHKWYCPINRKVVYRDEFCCWAERRTDEIN